MGFNDKAVKDIGVLVLTLILFAAITTVVVPILLGSGTAAATALSDNTTITTEANTALEGAASASSSLYDFLPWLGVGLVVMAALGIRKVI